MKKILFYCLFFSFFASAQPHPINPSPETSFEEKATYFDPFSIAIFGNHLLADDSHFGEIPRNKIAMLKQKILYARKLNKFLMIDINLLKSNRLPCSVDLKGEVKISDKSVVRDLEIFSKNNFKIKASRGCWNSLSYKLNDQSLAFHQFPQSWRLVFLELLADSKISHIQISVTALSDPEKYKDLPASLIFKGLGQR